MLEREYNTNCTNDDFLCQPNLFAIDSGVSSIVERIKDACGCYEETKEVAFNPTSR